MSRGSRPCRPQFALLKTIIETPCNGRTHANHDHRRHVNGTGGQADPPFRVPRPPRVAENRFPTPAKQRYSGNRGGGPMIWVFVVGFLIGWVIGVLPRLLHYEGD
jgi:hypothetical protein